MTIEPVKVELGPEPVAIGIVISDSDASLAFYRDLLGMTHEGDMPMPVGGGGTMHRLRCGPTLVKLVSFDTNPEAKAPGGGFADGLGYRYITINVSNVADTVAACDEAGHQILMKAVELRPGVSIGMVADPDGNVVEFIQYG
ncbi:MAG: VOC family protein [Acidimicrobiales bacterium]|nr:VOC family protein [Acidimicrobiales bacterium]